MFPTNELPYYGIFVKEQMMAIESIYPEIQYDCYFIEGGGVLGGGITKSLKNYIRSINDVDRLIRRNKYDLVHIHYGMSGFFMLNPFRKRVPTILTLHGGDILKEQNGSLQVFLTKQVIRRVSHTITLNDVMYEIVRKLSLDTSIIPCAVDTDTFVTTTNCINASNVPLIVFPSSRHRKVKNFPLFIEVLSILKTDYNLACDYVEIDNMTRDEVSSIFKKADLMLMTSLSEGSPQVVKEAMACNLAIVSTPVGDVSVLLDGVEDCAVATSFDAQELANLCVRSLSRSMYGIKGREQIYKLGLSKEDVAKKIYMIYKKYAYEAHNG